MFPLLNGISPLIAWLQVGLLMTVHYHQVFTGYVCLFLSSFCSLFCPLYSLLSPFFSYLLLIMYPDTVLKFNDENGLVHTYTAFIPFYEIINPSPSMLYHVKIALEFNGPYRFGEFSSYNFSWIPGILYLFLLLFYIQLLIQLLLGPRTLADGTSGNDEIVKLLPFGDGILY